MSPPLRPPTLAIVAGPNGSGKSTFYRRQERNRLLEDLATFAIETVFSRRDYWIDFIKRAKLRGYLSALDSDGDGGQQVG